MPNDKEIVTKVQPDAFDFTRDRKENQKSGECYEIHCCERHEHKTYDVYLPVSVEPYVYAYRPEAKCEGEMKTEHGYKHCDDECMEFRYTLKQKLSVNIPIVYGVLVHYGKPCAVEEK